MNRAGQRPLQWCTGALPGPNPEVRLGQRRLRGKRRAAERHTAAAAEPVLCLIDKAAGQTRLRQGCPACGAETAPVTVLVLALDTPHHRSPFAGDVALVRRASGAMVAPPPGDNRAAADAPPSAAVVAGH